MVPTMNDHEVEQEIKAKGLNAKRITKEQIDELVGDLTVHTHIVPGTTCTLAAAVMPNDYVVAIASSACVSKANFDADLGEKIATTKVLEAARNELWELEGYRLKHELS